MSSFRQHALELLVRELHVGVGLVHVPAGFSEQLLVVLRLQMLAAEGASVSF